MSVVFTMPEPGRRRWCDDPDGARALLAPTYPRTPKIELVTDAPKRSARVAPKTIPAPQPEEPTRSVARPPTTSGAAPRAAMPTISQAVPSAAPTGARGSSSAEGGIGVPGAGPGACGAGQERAERPVSEGPESAAAGGAGRAPITRRKPDLYTHEQRTMTAYQWAAEPKAKAAGLDRETVRGRLRNGWSVLAAITTPRNTTGRRRTHAS